MRQVILVALAGLLIVGASPAARTADTIEWAVYNFDQPAKVLDRILSGKYLFVHDMAAMGRGEPCTTIYEWQGKPGKKVLAFHCRPINRTVAKKFTAVLGHIDPVISVRELKEFQFAHSSEGHRLPK